MEFGVGVMGQKEFVFKHLLPDGSISLRKVSIIPINPFFFFPLRDLTYGGFKILKVTFQTQVGFRQPAEVQGRGEKWPKEVNCTTSCWKLDMC